MKSHFWRPLQESGWQNDTVIHQLRERWNFMTKLQKLLIQDMVSKSFWQYCGSMILKEESVESYEFSFRDSSIYCKSFWISNRSLYELGTIKIWWSCNQWVIFLDFSKYNSVRQQNSNLDQNVNGNQICPDAHILALPKWWKMVFLPWELTSMKVITFLEIKYFPW
jgi:hypothetical protein